MEYKIDWVCNKPVDKKIIDEGIELSIRQGNRFTNGGPNVVLLEKLLRQKLEINYEKAIIAVVNGTCALHILA